MAGELLFGLVDLDLAGRLRRPLGLESSCRIRLHPRELVVDGRPADAENLSNIGGRAAPLKPSAGMQRLGQRSPPTPGFASAGCRSRGRPRSNEAIDAFVPISGSTSRGPHLP